MPSELLKEQKEKLIARATQERKSYVQPDLVAALALVEILELLEEKLNAEVND